MKISIVTITFNSERTVKETFDSVLQQSYRPLQYIVVDGLSKDSTMDIVRSYEPKFKEAGIEFVYKSEKDNGISDAFNKGVLQADGDIIGIINSDDMLYKDALETVAKNVEEDVQIYYGQCMIFRDGDDSFYLATPDKDVSGLKKTMVIYHPACFVTRETYEKYGVFDPAHKYSMDRELMLRFYTKGCRFKYIPAPLACYREGGNNQVNYRKTVYDGVNISMKYGTSKAKALFTAHKSMVKYYIWRFIQRIGAESLFHKKM